ncbi:hypothetical protein SFRURICE_005943, partial [Spodoptera frugiperda]
MLNLIYCCMTLQHYIIIYLKFSLKCKQLIISVCFYEHNVIKVRNSNLNTIAFSSFNIYLIRIQWALGLQLDSIKFQNINVDRSKLDSKV